MINNNLRIGNFTSSQIYRLMKNDRAGTGLGAPALSYIEEKAMETLLGRSLNSETNAKPTMWGKVLEEWAFTQPEIFPIAYQTASQGTIKHPTLNWSGSRDGVRYDGLNPFSVFDLKCPWTLKSFMHFCLSGNMDEVRQNHDDGEKYYWQIVSNAILSEVNHGELIVFVPKQSQLTEIREFIEGDKRGYNLFYSEDEELPYVPDAFDKNLVRFQFEIPQSDKDLLTTRVKLACELLNNKIKTLKK